MSNLYKTLFFVLCFVVSSTILHAEHYLRLGLQAGGIGNVAKYENTLKNKVGFSGAFDIDYLYFSAVATEKRSLDLGVRAGLNIGYAGPRYSLAFSDQFSAKDYLDNIIEYTTSGECQVKANRMTLSIPVMFALRANGFVFDIGPIIRINLLTKATQRFENSLVAAYYPAYGVEVTTS